MSITAAKKITAALLVLLTVLACSCELAPRDNVNDPESGDYSVGIAGVNPGNNETIAGHEPIVIQFTDSMDKDSVQAGISGDIIKGNCTFTWSNTLYNDDTLTISLIDGSTPAFWQKGSDKKLVITGKTSGGESLTAVTVTYTIDYIIYVRTGADGGDDLSNIGTSGSPVATIQKGINLAGVIYSGSTSKVYVAEGTYSGTGPIITMADGISLFGAYKKDDWGARDKDTYNTRLIDTSSSGGTGPAYANKVVNCGSGFTVDTYLDGFTITCGKGDHNTAIYCNVSEDKLIIQNNNINGRTSASDAGANAYGIVANESNVVIKDNTIQPGWNSGTTSCGIYCIASSCTIDNNNIYGGYGGIETCGIYCESSSSPVIEKNPVIDCGSNSGLKYSIYTMSCSPFVNNNNFTVTETSGSVTFFQRAGTAPDLTTVTPHTFNNNNFNWESGVWYNDNGTIIDKNNISNQLVNIGGTDQHLDDLGNSGIGL